MPEKAKLEGKSKGKDKTEGQSVSAQPSRSQSTSQGQPPPAAGVPGDGAAPADDVHDPAQALAVNGAADVNWVDIQKHFGPLHMQRIGVGFAEDKDGGRINAAISAALAVGPLQVALSGLGVHYKLKTKDLKFVLAGLGVDFKRGPLEMGGTFLRLEHDEFAGKIAIHASKFKLNAVGSYGVHGGSPSLFLYAFLDMPLGGPPFFFVEGLAFAFGLNRRLSTSSACRP